MKYIPTSITQLDRIKHRAKQLRSQFERLGHARDAAAREAGYDDYHHAFHCASSTRPATQPTTGSAEPDDLLVAAVVARIGELLALDPAVDLSNPRVRDAMTKFQGLRTASLLSKATYLAHPQDFYKAALNDFNALDRSGFPPAVSNTSPIQRKLGLAAWCSFLHDDNRERYELLYAYCYMKVFAGFAAWRAQIPATHPSAFATERLLQVMQALMERRDVNDALDFLHGTADELMPREMNVSIHTREDDLDAPSSWWSRIQGTVSIEIVGVCSILPFGAIGDHLAQDAGGQLPFLPLYAPTDSQMKNRYNAEARLRWMALSA